MNISNLDLKEVALKRVLPVGMVGIMATTFVGCSNKQKNVPVNEGSIVVTQSSLTTTTDDEFSQKYEQDKQDFKDICIKHFDDSFFYTKTNLIETQKGENTTLRLVNVEDIPVKKLNEFLDDINSRFDYSSLMTDGTVIKLANNLHLLANNIKELSIYSSSVKEPLNISKFKAVEVLDLNNAHAMISKLPKLKTIIISSSDENERYDKELTSLPESVENVYIANVNIDGAVISCNFCSLYYDEKSADNIPESDVTFVDTSTLHVNSLGPTVKVKGNIKKEIRGKGNVDIGELENCDPYININGEKIEETTKEKAK